MLADTNNRFPAPTEAQLQNIGIGCFVQISSNNGCFWVEVDEEENGILSGIVHSELETINCQKITNGLERIEFSRDQVTYLGCDRYCFC